MHHYLAQEPAIVNTCLTEYPSIQLKIFMYLSSRICKHHLFEIIFCNARPAGCHSYQRHFVILCGASNYGKKVCKSHVKRKVYKVRSDRDGISHFMREQRVELLMTAIHHHPSFLNDTFYTPKRKKHLFINWLIVPLNNLSLLAPCDNYIINAAGIKCLLKMIWYLAFKPIFWFCN